MLPFLEADWVALFELHYDFTNMVPSQTTYKFGLREKSPSIIKPMLMDREAKILSILRQLAFVPKLMTGSVLNDRFNSIVFSLKDNRKSDGRR